MSILAGREARGRRLLLEDNLGELEKMESSGPALQQIRVLPLSLDLTKGSFWDLRGSVGIYRFDPELPAPNSSPLYP